MALASPFTVSECCWHLCVKSVEAGNEETYLSFHAAVLGLSTSLHLP